MQIPVTLTVCNRPANHAKARLFAPRYILKSESSIFKKVYCHRRPTRASCTCSGVLKHPVCIVFNLMIVWDARRQDRSPLLGGQARFGCDGLLPLSAGLSLSSGERLGALLRFELVGFQRPLQLRLGCLLGFLQPLLMCQPLLHSTWNTFLPTFVLF